MSKVCVICGSSNFTFKQTVIQTITINNELNLTNEVVDEDVINKSIYLRCSDCNQISLSDDLVTEEQFHEVVAVNDTLNEDLLKYIRDNNVSTETASLIAQARIVLDRKDSTYTIIKSLDESITGEYTQEEALTVFYNEGIVLILNDEDGGPTINWVKGGI